MPTPPSTAEEQLRVKAKLRAAYLATFETEAGRIVLENLARHCSINFSSFDPNPYQAAFNEGKRAIYLGIKNMLREDVLHGPARSRTDGDPLSEFNVTGGWPSTD